MSLAELIASGDEDAIAGFRDAHVDKVQAYCTVACEPGKANDACEAAFVDFLGRALTTPESERRQLEELLLKATRSAAAARFRVPDTAPAPTRPELCAATPELLAARANGELPADDHGLSAHLKHCPRCRASAAQIERADAAFGASLGWAEPVASEETGAAQQAADHGGPPAGAERGLLEADTVAAEPSPPSPPPPSPPLPPAATPSGPRRTVARGRRRVVSAAKRLGKQLGGGPGRVAAQPRVPAQPRVVAQPRVAVQPRVVAQPRALDAEGEHERMWPKQPRLGEILDCQINHPALGVDPGEHGPMRVVHRLVGDRTMDVPSRGGVAP